MQAFETFSVLPGSETAGENEEPAETKNFGINKTI